MVVGLAQVRRMEVFVPVFVLCEKWDVWELTLNMA